MKRHSSTHFANINYGYYVLGISTIYVIFLMVLRKVLVGKPAGLSTSKMRKFLYQLYLLNPALHLFILWLLVLIPFYSHYSLTQDVTVYIKRLGRLSYVLLTMNLILTLRPNWLMYQDYTYTDFIPLHKWLSRTIVLAAVVHGIMFLAYWSLNSTKSVATGLKNFRNLLGLIIMILICMLILSSTGPMRRLNYNFFYVMHNIVTFGLIFITALHARPGVAVPYLIINAIILLVHAFGKAFFARRVDLLEKNADYKNTNLVNVQLPRAAVPETFEPGCHIRISPYRRLNPLYWLLPSHPFTVASLPSDSKVDLLIAESSHPRSFKLELGAPYTIINQYTPAVPRTCLKKAKRVCIICGGSGISFGLPLYRYFKEVYPVEFLQFAWLVKDKYQLGILEKLTCASSFDGSSDFHIYITKNVENMVEADQAEPDLEFELESLSHEQLDENGAILNDGVASAGSKLKAASVNIGRRIDWVTDLSHFVEKSLVDDTWMIACGPTTLIESAREYAADNGINFASEIYAL